MTKRFQWAAMASLVAALVLVPQAFAQIPTGTLTGRVVDDAGAGLPGVLVTVESEAVQGNKTTYTGANGDYKVPFLPPGVYKLTFDLDGFTSVSTERKVSAAQTTTVDVTLRATEVIEETIMVTSQFETISQTRTGSSTITSDELEKLAVSRDLDDTALLTPGVSNTGPGSTEDAPVVRISGAMSFENLFLVNGVVVNENLRGQDLPLFIEDAIEETTTSVSGISAEYGRFTGGVINAITKSGGNQIEGSIRVNFDNDDWISSNELSPERADELNETYEGTLGGYFWKDHIWFFTAGRDVETTGTGTTRAITNLSFPTSDSETRLEGKLTFAITPRHNVVASYQDIERSRTNTSFGTFIDLRSLNPSRKDPQDLKSFNYNGVLSSSFFLEAQYSERDFTIGIGSGGVPDLIEGTLIRRRQNAQRFHAPTFCGSCEDEVRNNENLLAKGSYFLTSKGAGTHDLVFGYDTFDDVRFAVNHQTGSDFTVYSSNIVVDPATQEIFAVFDPSTAWIRWFAIINLDLAQPTSFKTNSYYVNDSWQLSDKWSFNLGVRYDENDGSNSAGASVANDSKVSPRLGLTYDVKGDGDLLINASYGTYVGAIANSLADSTSNGGAVSDFIWFYRGPVINGPDTCSASNTSGCVSNSDALRILFDWYRSVGGTTDSPFNIDPNAPLNGFNFISDVPGETSRILDTVKSQSADELTLGVVKRFGSRGSVRADLVFRQWDDFYSNRTTPNSPVVTVPGGLQVHQTEVGNFGNDILTREYSGLHTAFRYRLSDRLSVAANYSLSKLEGNVVGENTTSGPLFSSPNSFGEYLDPAWSFREGDLTGDQRHKLNAWLIYDLIESERNNLSVSLTQSFFSGAPYGAVGAVDTRPFVNNPGYFENELPTNVTYFFTGRDEFKTDDITRTDIGLNYSFYWHAFGRRMQVFIQPEILNVFNEDGVIDVNSDVLDATNSSGFASFNPFTEVPVEGVHWAKDPDFGKPQNEDDFQQPRLFRVSLGFRF